MLCERVHVSPSDHDADVCELHGQVHMLGTNCCAAAAMLISDRHRLRQPAVDISQTNLSLAPSPQPAHRGSHCPAPVPRLPLSISFLNPSRYAELFLGLLAASNPQCYPHLRFTRDCNPELFSPSVLYHVSLPALVEVRLGLFLVSFFNPLADANHEGATVRCPIGLLMPEDTGFNDSTSTYISVTYGLCPVHTLNPGMCSPVLKAHCLSTPELHAVMCWFVTGLRWPKPEPSMRNRSRPHPSGLLKLRLKAQPITSRKRSGLVMHFEACAGTSASYHAQ